jgi:chromosome segregation ATPase
MTPEAFAKAKAERPSAHAIIETVLSFSPDLHEQEDCPQDDTCECEEAFRMEAALQGISAFEEALEAERQKSAELAAALIQWQRDFVVVQQERDELRAALDGCAQQREAWRKELVACMEQRDEHRGEILGLLRKLRECGGEA